MPKNKLKSYSHSINFWVFLRDVFIAALNKGQFLPAASAALFGLMIIKMPAADVSKLVFQILDKIEKGYHVGYILFGVVSLTWFFHAKWQRRVVVSELDRLAQERNRLQGGDIESSNG